MEFNKLDLVQFGWDIGSFSQYHPTPYYYLGTNSVGDYILENPETHGVFLAKLIRHFE